MHVLPLMSIISIIGSGTMATAVAGRIANAGHIVEVVNRDAAKRGPVAEVVVRNYKR